ncbi:MAG: VCBS repeat-containing protein, partial [Acidobacteria bacterium]|nr:VCBS repeat-containing protein [Acidobacteriota bacterium]
MTHRQLHQEAQRSQRSAWATAIVAWALLALPSLSAAESQIHLRRVSLDLPGAPAAVVATDLDGDGRQDLAVAVVYTIWDQIELEETTEMDGVEGLVEVLTIVPALLDHRELLFFLAEETGGYRRAADPLLLDPSVLSIEAGPEARGLLALTDQGLSRLRWPLPEGGLPPFESLVEEAPVLAGTGSFFPPLGLLQELDGMPGEDLLLPAPGGYSVYLNRGADLFSEASQQGILPFFSDLPSQDGGDLIRIYPVPEVRDADGDGRADLLFLHPRRRGSELQLSKNLGGRFGPLESPLEGFPPPSGETSGEEKAEGDEEAVLFDDLDGDGRAELVT